MAYRGHIPRLHIGQSIAPGAWLDTVAALLPDVTAGKTIVLLGKRGCGKTQAATELALAFNAREHARQWEQYRAAMAGQRACRDSGRRPSGHMAAPMVEAPTLYTTAAELWASIRTGQDRGSDEMTEASRFRRASMLIIDELHERGNTDAEDRMLIGLLDFRYRMQVGPTVLITNLDAQALARGLGHSVMRRVAEMGRLVDLSESRAA